MCRVYAVGRPAGTVAIQDNTRECVDERHQMEPSGGDDHIVTIERMDGGPRLVIEQPALIVSAFIRNDSGGRQFDARAGQGDPNRIESADILAINQMRSRSASDKWEELMPIGTTLPWLEALDQHQPLFDLDERAWIEDGWEGRIGLALDSAMGPHRKFARATKMLHLKRPNLIPLIDRLVIEQLGAVGASAIKIVAHLRREGENNRASLGIASAKLEKVNAYRTPVRILDVLLWASHPAARLGHGLSNWARHMSPRPGMPVEPDYRLPVMVRTEPNMNSQPRGRGGRWTNDELLVELAGYEELCRANGMTDKARFSYWDYARRFLAWRVGDYRPSGATGRGPVPRRGPATVADLTSDAKEYAADVEAAGKAQDTIDTYFRHAMFFVRWLDGTFIPGAKLRDR